MLIPMIQGMNAAGFMALFEPIIGGFDGVRDPKSTRAVHRRICHRRYALGPRMQTNPLVAGRFHDFGSMLEKDINSPFKW